MLLQRVLIAASIIAFVNSKGSVRSPERPPKGPQLLHPANRNSGVECRRHYDMHGIIGFEGAAEYGTDLCLASSPGEEQRSPGGEKPRCP